MTIIAGVSSAITSGVPGAFVGLPWWQKRFPGATIAADFERGLFHADGAARLVTDIIADTRSSPIVLPDANGVLRVIASGEPAHTSRGLGSYGAASPLINYSDDFSHWSTQNDATINAGGALGADGAMSAAIVAGGAGQSSSAIYYALPLITEKRIKLAFRVAALTASKLDFGIYQSGFGWYNQTSQIKSGPGTVGPYSGAGLQRLVGLSDSAWTEVEVSLDAPQSGSALKVYFYPDGATLSAGKSIILDFAQATDAPGEVIISPDLRTNGALVARAPCHPVPVPGVDDTPFIGADESGKLTIALAWSGVPVDTGGSRVLLQAQAAANYGTDNGNRLLFYLTSTNRLDLAVVGAGSSSVNAGVSFDDEGQHTAIIEIDRGTGHYGMAVDGGAFVSGSALANMPASLDRITLGHRLSGPTAADHMNGHVTGFAAANALRGYAWNQSG